MVGATDNPRSFRTKILHGEFNAIQISDTVWVTIQPDFKTMYPRDQHFMPGKVVAIMGDDNHRDCSTRLVVVATDLGQFTFTRDGLSLNKIYALSVHVRATGQMLCLYEPIFVSSPPPTERQFIKTAECGCGPDGPCALHRSVENWWEKCGMEIKNTRRELV